MPPDQPRHSFRHPHAHRGRQRPVPSHLPALPQIQHHPHNQPRRQRLGGHIRRHHHRRRHARPATFTAAPSSTSPATATDSEPTKPAPNNTQPLQSPHPGVGNFADRRHKAAAAMAPSRARSSSASAGRLFCRCRTASERRSTMISRSFERPERTAKRANDTSNRYRIRHIEPQDVGASCLVC